MWRSERIGEKYGYRTSRPFSPNFNKWNRGIVALPPHPSEQLPLAFAYTDPTIDNLHLSLKQQDFPILSIILYVYTFIVHISI